MDFKMRRTKLRLLLASIASLSLGMTLAAASTPDPRLGLCGDGRDGNRATASFEIRDAREVWRFLPAMKMAPELLEVKGTAFVVLFDNWTGQGAFGPVVGSNVVCVVDGAGNPNTYTDVARDGLSVP
jgi:hypothetical protein